jgi:hypothetical protein
MLQYILTVLGAIFVLYVLGTLGVLVYNKYFKGTDGFQGTRSQPTMNKPAYAPPVQQEIPEPPKITTPSGPNSPNAEAPRERVVIPEEKPKDPYDEVNTEVPMTDNLRHPERSFGPGVENNGTNRSISAGTASNSVNNPSLNSFSPEFAQNGGDFMQGISANDMGMGSEYATI